MPNRPYFDTVEIKGGGDAASAARAVLQTGEYDFALEPAGRGRGAASAWRPPARAASSSSAERQHRDRSSSTWPTRATEVDGERASPKSRHPILSDRAVREALALLVDRKSVQEFVYGRAGVATPNFLNNPARFNSPNIKDEFSVDKANAVLDAAGWKRGADGVREKDGRKLKLLFQTSINSVRQKVQSIYKQACAKAGIELELKARARRRCSSRPTSANPDTYGKFWADLQMYTVAGRQPDPERFMQWFVSWQVVDQGQQVAGLQPRALGATTSTTRPIRAAEVELDPVKRAALFIRDERPRLQRPCGDPGGLPADGRRPRRATWSRRCRAGTTRSTGLADWYRETA